MAFAKIDVHGHRGARAVLPENTLIAFQEALDSGVEYLELDMGVSKDNVIVVTHDQYINPNICQYENGQRITKKIPIRSLTLQEIKELDCGTLINKKFPKQVPAPGQKIPTLEEVFELVQKSSLPVAKTVQFNIETKIEEDLPELTPTPEEFVKLVMEVVRKFEFEKRIILQSFDYRTLKAIRATHPSIRTSALIEGFFANVLRVAREVKPDIVSPDYSLLSKNIVNELHKMGIKVVPWTANDPKSWSKLISWGVDGIITDDPRGLIGYLKQSTD